MKDIGEFFVLNCVGGVLMLVVGIVYVFYKVLLMVDMGFWYYFGILFEVLFILIVLDVGICFGCFML